MPQRYAGFGYLGVRLAAISNCLGRVQHRLYCLAACAAVLLQTVNIHGSESVGEFASVEAAYAAQLTELAKWCDEHELSSPAELTRNWLPNRDPLKDYVFLIPENAEAPTGLIGSHHAKEWWKQFMDLRRMHAEKLFDLAAAAAKDKRPATAIQLARGTLRENPDHAKARRILGYEKYDNRWVSPRTAQFLKLGKTWSDQFGWLPADQLEKYKAGQRFFRGKWIDAAEDARLRSNINNAWQIETEHYQVRTTHSLEEGVSLARKLESLYDVWKAVFVDYYATADAIEKWFASGAASNANSARKPFTVVLFRDKQEYVDVVRKYQPQVAMSIGTYLDRLKVAYFFAGKEQVPTTLYHEATHQLFREDRPGVIEPGRKNNFWVVEAIACYMESLTEHHPLKGQDYGMYFTLGGVNEGRVPAARARLNDPENLFFLPLRELVSPGMDEFQRNPNLPQIYSQSSGLAWFLMHAEDNRYRPALMNLLLAVYTGRANETTLEKLTESKYEELDTKYREFMK